MHTLFLLACLLHMATQVSWVNAGGWILAGSIIYRSVSRILVAKWVVKIRVCDVLPFHLAYEFSIRNALIRRQTPIIIIIFFDSHSLGRCLSLIWP